MTEINVVPQELYGAAGTWASLDGDGTSARETAKAALEQAGPAVADAAVGGALTAFLSMTEQRFDLAHRALALGFGSLRTAADSYLDVDAKSSARVGAQSDGL